MKLPAIFNNKYVYYATLGFAGFNLMGYFGEKAYECLVLFIVSVYMSEKYLKNKTAALLAGIFIANFIFGCGRAKEGFIGDVFKGVKEHMEDAKESMSNACSKAKKQEDCTEDGCEWKNDVCMVKEAATNVQDTINKATKAVAQLTKSIAQKKKGEACTKKEECESGKCKEGKCE